MRNSEGLETLTFALFMAIDSIISRSYLMVSPPPPPPRFLCLQNAASLRPAGGIGLKRVLPQRWAHEALVFWPSQHLSGWNAFSVLVSNLTSSRCPTIVDNVSWSSLSSSFGFPVGNIIFWEPWREIGIQRQVEVPHFGFFDDWIDNRAYVDRRWRNDRLFEPILPSGVRIQSSNTAKLFKVGGVDVTNKYDRHTAFVGVSGTVVT